MSFSAKFNLAVEWFDSRLTWNNLNDDKYLNILDQNTVKNLWVPKVIFENTEDKFETPLDGKARLIVEKKEKYTLADETETEETAYYKGSENSIEYSRDFYLRFKCDYELRYYPFDRQVCSILLNKPGKQAKFLHLVPAYTLILNTA